MRAWLRQERSDFHDEHIIYRLIGVMEGIEKKVEMALKNCRSAAQEYLSIEQAATMTSLSSSHLRRALKRGELPAANIGTPERLVWRIGRKDLIDWLEKRKGGMPAIPPKAELMEAIKRHRLDV